MMDPLSLKESTPSIQQYPTKLRSPSGSPHKKQRKLSLLFRKLLLEWNYLLVKLKTFADVSYVEEVLEELFQLSDDDLLERYQRSGGSATLTRAEHDFLEAYKRHKLLEKVYEAHVGMAEAPAKNVMLDTLTMSLGTKTDENGELMWRHRRAKWLALGLPRDETDAKVAQRAQQLSLKHISRDMYPRIYRDFVDKLKPLKADKRINLEDLVAVINAGWISDERWERAANGLP